MLTTRYLSKRKLVANVLYRFRKFYETFVAPSGKNDDEYSCNLYLRSVKADNDIEFQITIVVYNTTGGLRTWYDDFFVENQERAEACYKEMKHMLIDIRDHFEYHRKRSMYINKDIASATSRIKEKYQKK